jgi:hypothetical protein
MHVLLIRSDLPESPEVLLLAGILSDRGALGWIPTPEAIVCRLIKLWSWVAEHGHRDSDSLDYWIPSPVLPALEMQFGCAGLIAAMCDARIDWCRSDSVSGRTSFCRFAEWNGDQAMRRRGDSVRARNSRTRSRVRMGKSVAKMTPETVPKAHANRDARHTSRAPSIDVDVDVSKVFKKTSTSTSEPGCDPLVVFAMIRRALRSAVGADDAQVKQDRETAWKSAVVIAEHLGQAWIERVLASATKKGPRRPYAYLHAALSNRLEDDGASVDRLFADLSIPDDLADPEDVTDMRLQRATPKPRGLPAEEQRRYQIRRELIASGLRGEELAQAFESATTTSSK